MDTEVMHTLDFNSKGDAVLTVTPQRVTWSPEGDVTGGRVMSADVSTGPMLVEVEHDPRPYVGNRVYVSGNVKDGITEGAALALAADLVAAVAALRARDEYLTEV